MPRFKIIFLLFAFAQTLFAGSDLRSRLIDLNSLWAYRSADLAFVENDRSSYSENELIQKHLLLVHARLSRKDVSSLSAIQKENRKRGLEQLLQYAEHGRFPQNVTHAERRPVFIDHRGVHCAVGYLIMRSGSRELSNRISANMNYYYLKDMEDEGLKEWVAQSGFSVDELAWIQPGYVRPMAWEGMKGGLNGPVHAIATNNGGGVFAGGFFDTAGSQPSNNYAEYYAGVAGFDWMHGTNAAGPDGVVYDILRHNGDLYIAGEFFSFDGIPVGAPVVKYKGGVWTGLGDFYVGAMVNKVNDLEIYRDTLYAAGFFRVVDGSQAFFNIAKWDGTEWVRAVADTTLPDQFMGEIRTLHVHNGKLFAGGEFQLPNGAKNIFAINGNTVEKLDAQLPNEVFALETHNGELFAGSSYYSFDQQDTAGFTAYRNSEWERLTPVWDQMHMSEHTAVRALRSTPEGLVLGGDFFYAGMGDYYQNIASYHNGGINSLGSLDSTVTALHYENDFLYAGGHFTKGLTATGYVPLGHITSLYFSNVGLDEVGLQALKLFPNPATSLLNVETAAVGDIDKLEVFDMKGSAVGVPYRHSRVGAEVDVSRLSPGQYLVRIHAGDAVLEEKVLIAD